MLAEVSSIRTKLVKNMAQLHHSLAGVEGWASTIRTGQEASLFRD